MIRAIVNSILFSVIGVGLMVGLLSVVDLLTPGSLRQHIVDEKHMPLAVVTGFMCLGIAIIVAVAIH